MNTPGRMDAGERVRLARGQRGISQAALADLAGVDPGTISSLETGKRWPRAGQQAKITKALGWPDGELERLARSYAPASEAEPSSGEAVVITLSAALSTFERSIMESDLPAELKLDVIKMHRRVGADELLKRIAEEIPRRSNG